MTGTIFVKLTGFEHRGLNKIVVVRYDYNDGDDGHSLDDINIVLCSC